MGKCSTSKGDCSKKTVHVKGYDRCPPKKR